MTELDRLLQIRKETIDVQTKLMSSDVEEVKAAMKEYEQLVDWFCNESGDFMAPQQYEAAKQDLEYFISLIDLAEAYHKEKDL
jgi:hypothetical protein